MTAMMVPVTTGGKKRSMRDTIGAISIDMTPAPMMAPKSSCAPAWPGLALAIATMGATEAKVTPIITGSLMPNHCVAPSAWISVAMPQQNRSAEISSATSCGAQLERAADDQRHRDGARIHHEHVLQAEGGELAGGQPLIDGVDGRRG